MGLLTPQAVEIAPMHADERNIRLDTVNGSWSHVRCHVWRIAWNLRYVRMKFSAHIDRQEQFLRTGRLIRETSRTRLLIMAETLTLSIALREI